MCMCSLLQRTHVLVSGTAWWHATPMDTTRPTPGTCTTVASGNMHLCRNIWTKGPDLRYIVCGVSSQDISWYHVNSQNVTWHHVSSQNVTWHYVTLVYCGYCNAICAYYVLFCMQCVTVTACGNFAIIGMNTGHVEMFNMQSGLHRGEFGRPRGL